MSMVAIERVLSIPFQHKAPCEIWEKLVSEKKKFQNFIHVYSPGARDNPQTTMFLIIINGFVGLL